MQVECIQDERAFLALRDHWEGLRADSVNPSYFLSHDWMRCCWEELKANHAMRVFIARSEGHAVLIAPLMISRRSSDRLPATSLTFMEHPETQVSDLLILEGEEGAAAADALVRHLLAERGDEWNLLLLDKIPCESPTRGYLKSADGGRTGWESEVSHESLILSLSGTWDDYLAAQSPRFRKTLRNIINRMRKLGRLEVRSYQGKRAEEALEKIFWVSQSSWKVADGVAITSSTQRMQFFRDLAAGTATAEGLRIVVLEVNGMPTASEIQAVDGQTVYALRSDYDERYADSSPGTFLQMEILQELFASSYSEYNFGVGVNPYKTRWTEERRPLLRYHLYNRTLYGRFLRTVKRCEPRLAKIPGLRLFGQVIAGK